MAFFRKLADMKPQMRTGHTLMAELVASGEIPLAATIYNHNAERLKTKGAPIQWKALNPTFGPPNRVTLANQAPRPHAALLINDFPYQMIDPVVVIDEAGKWEKRWSELFLKGQAIRREKE